MCTYHSRLFPSPNAPQHRGVRPLTRGQMPALLPRLRSLQVCATRPGALHSLLHVVADKRRVPALRRPPLRRLLRQRPHLPLLPQRGPRCEQGHWSMRGPVVAGALPCWDIRPPRRLHQPRTDCASQAQRKCGWQVSSSRKDGTCRCEGGNTCGACSAAATIWASLAFTNRCTTGGTCLPAKQAPAGCCRQARSHWRPQRNQGPVRRVGRT